jgi:hypothetical protein
VPIEGFERSDDRNLMDADDSVAFDAEGLCRRLTVKNSDMVGSALTPTPTLLTRNSNYACRSISRRIALGCAKRPHEGLL